MKEGPVSAFSIMGVINVTPDSFSDGGLHLAPTKAVEAALRLLDEGADVVDVGAESTRPGAEPVAIEDEWARLRPVLEELTGRGLGSAISVDTRKPDLMRRAAALGVRMINDVGGGADDATLRELARYPEMSYCAMHMRETPATMQKDPLRGPDAVRAVERFFDEASGRLARAGFAPERVWLDPGIGFGKTDGGNLQLMAAVPRWSKTYQVAVGISRKGFIGRLVGPAEAKDRDPPSKMLELGLAIAGARMVRTHDVRRLAALRALLAEGR